MRRLVVLLLAYYGMWFLLIWTPALYWLTGANDESGPIYGFHSGFGGSVLFGAAMVAPVWYYARTCHHSATCLWYGKYQAAGGTFKLCHRHHPDLQGEKPHGELIHRLHREHQARGRM